MELSRTRRAGLAPESGRERGELWSSLTFRDFVMPVARRRLPLVVKVVSAGVATVATFVKDRLVLVAAYRHSSSSRPSPAVRSASFKRRIRLPRSGSEPSPPSRTSIASLTGDEEVLKFSLQRNLITWPGLEDFGELALAVAADRDLARGLRSFDGLIDAARKREVATQHPGGVRGRRGA